MSSTLNIKYQSLLDNTLSSLYTESESSAHWDDWVKSLDSSIISSYIDSKWTTRLEFKSENHKTIFIMRWS